MSSEATMFNPFKKKIHISMSDIDKLLQDFRLYGQALMIR